MLYRDGGAEKWLKKSIFIHEPRCPGLDYANSWMDWAMIW